MMESHGQKNDQDQPLPSATPPDPRWRRLIQLRTYLVQVPLFALSTAFFGSLSLIASLFDSSGRRQHALARMWAKSLLLFSFSPVKVVGLERLSAQTPCVYVANHLSYMDTPVIFSSLPEPFRILARADLFTIPFMGWHLRRSGQLPVDSTSLHSGLRSLNHAVRSLKQGMSIFVFPEGSRTPDGHLKPFANGPAYMAVKAQVPIVPIALVGTYELLPIHTYHLRPRPLLLIAGEPIATTDYTSRQLDQLTARVQQSIAELYYHYSELTAPD